MYINERNSGPELVFQSRSRMSREERRRRFPLQVLPNFGLWEIVCPCCGVYILESKYLKKVQELRHRVRGPITVHSWYRCHAYNSRPEIRGALNSNHMYGIATDVSSPHISLGKIVSIARALGFFTILYGNHVHIDGRNW